MRRILKHVVSIAMPICVSLLMRRSIPHGKLSPMHLGYVNGFKCQRRCIYGPALIATCQFVSAPASVVPMCGMSDSAAEVHSCPHIGADSLDGIIFTIDKFHRCSIDRVLAVPATVLPFPAFDAFVTRRELARALCNRAFVSLFVRTLLG